MEADLAASQESLVQTCDFPNKCHLSLQVPQGRCHLVEVGCDCSHSAEEETEGSKDGEKAEVTVAAPFRSSSEPAVQGSLTSPQRDLPDS